MEHIPQQPKRFPLQQEQFAKEYIYACRDAVNETKKVFPEIISATLYGSLARGRAKEETSDIDCMIFVDVDHLTAIKNVTFNEKNLSYSGLVNDAQHIFIKSDADIIGTKNVEGKEYFLVRPSIYFFEEEQDIYKKPIQEKIMKKLPSISEEKLYHVAPVPLSKNFISTVIKIAADAHDSPEEFKNKVIHTLSEKVMFEIARKPGSVCVFAFPEQFYQIFQLELGTGIAPYRQHLMHELEALGDVGEGMWKSIVRQLEYREQYKSDSKESVHYPKTITEAKKYFKLK